MFAHVAAIRAISSLYARRRTRWFFLIGAAILALLFAFTVYLAQEVSAWWWLLAIPVVSFGVFFAVLWAATRALINKLTPAQSPDQREAVAHFVTRFDEVVETMQTPRFMVFIYLIRDAFTGNQHGFLQQVVSRSKALRTDFERLIALFQPLEK